MKPIIGISGQKKSGKDTVYGMIDETLSGDCTRFAFADELKREISFACNVTVDYINEHKDRFRPILQWWGTEFRRFDNDTYWIDALAEIMSRSDANVRVITDVRFHNEAKFVKDNGGVIISVVRVDDYNPVKVDLHDSETQMIGYPSDYTIFNRSGDFTNLRKDVEFVLSDLIKKGFLK